MRWPEPRRRTRTRLDAVMGWAPGSVREVKRLSLRVMACKAGFERVGPEH
jgi:hypothetical protein